MLSRKNLGFILGMLLLLIVIAGCIPPPPQTSEPAIQPSTTIPSVNLSTSPTVTNEPTPTEIPQPTVTHTPEPTPTVALTPLPSPPTPEVEWIADSIINEGEYPHFMDFFGLRFWWRNDAVFLYFAMEADTTGWVAVGFDPESRMQGANFIFGFYAENQAKIWDAYGTAPTGPNHPPDEDLGGTVDIVSFAGDEINGVTTFEVQIPLDSGDDYDKAMVAGQTYPYIIAMGGEDSFNGYHIKYAGGQLILDN